MATNPLVAATPTPTATATATRVKDDVVIIAPTRAAEAAGGLRSSKRESVCRVSMRITTPATHLVT